ncbi:MAG: OFA family MFS transporter [Planctomycetes bacterium]|nr:OFA family MFS transporter [Planctomycetota bacterium]
MTTLSASAAALSIDRSATGRWLVPIGAVLVQLILGTVYGYSVFWQPLESELWPGILTTQQAAAVESAGQALPAGAVVVADAAAAARERETRIGYLKYSFAICLLCFAGAMIFAGRIQDVKGPRFTALLGGAILALGFLVAGQMDHLVTFYLCHAVLMGVAVTVALLAFERLSRGVDRNRYPALQFVPLGLITAAVVAGITLSQQYVSNDVHGRLLLLWGTIGVLAGVGIGFAYVCPIAALVKWFPAQKGLMAGIAVAGFGLGAYLFSQPSVIGAVGFIEKHGVRAFFTVHGLVCLIVVTLGALLLRNPPVVSPAATPVRGALAVADATWRDLLRTGRFYVVWLMFFSGAMSGLMVIGILKPFAGNQLLAAAVVAGTPLTDAIRADLLLKGAAAIGMLALFNAAGRIVWGLVSDVLGRVVSMVLMYLFQAATLLVLNTLDTELQLAVGAACVGFNFGGNFALFPSLTADMFGAKNFGANYAWVFTSYGVAGVIGVWVGNEAYQLSGSYFAAFAVAAVLCFLSAGLALTLRRSRVTA